MFSYWLRGYAGRSCIMTIRFFVHLKVRHRSSCIASWHLVFKFAVDNLVLVICTQLGLRKFFLFGTGLTGLITGLTGYSTLGRVQCHAGHADRSNRSVPPV